METRGVDSLMLAEQDIAELAAGRSGRMPGKMLHNGRLEWDKLSCFHFYEWLNSALACTEAPCFLVCAAVSNVI